MSSLFSISSQDEVQIVKVEDLLSEYGNKAILQATHTRINEGFHHFVIDMADTRYMNSVGLNLLISLQKELKKLGGQLVVANASTKIRQLIEITKLRHFFELYPSLEEAVAAFDEKE